MSQIGPAARAGPRLFMIGLDAVSLPFVRANLGRLPTLAGLLEEGALHDLESTATYLSASVWPTFSTGTQPGEHGQYFPFQWNGGQSHYRRVADRRWSNEFDVEPFWHRVAKAGVPTIAFDIAHALHDERAPCLQITNWSYQSSGDAKASDPGVLKDIQRRFGRRPIGPEVPVAKTARQCEAIRRQLTAAVRAKADATLYLMDKPWGLFVTGWYEAHRAGHNLWPVEGEFGSDASPDAMLGVYEETDRQLGRVLAALGDDVSVVLFTLHGMEPNRAQDHFLTEILKRLNELYLGGAPGPSKKPSAFNITAFLRAVLPPTLQYRTASLLGEKVQDWVVNRALTSGRTWSNTPSFPVLSGGEGLIRLNIKGREAQGFFERGGAEVADYVDWLRDRLAEITVVETGEQLIGNITITDDVYSGSRRDFLPDMVLQWAPEEPVSRIRSPAIGEIEFSLATGRGGNHNASAFVVAKGENALMQVVAPVREIADLGGIAERYLLKAAEPVAA